MNILDILDILDILSIAAAIATTVMIVVVVVMVAMMMVRHTSTTRELRGSRLERGNSGGNSAEWRRHQHVPIPPKVWRHRVPEGHNLPARIGVHDLVLVAEGAKEPVVELAVGAADPRELEVVGRPRLRQAAGRALGRGRDVPLGEDDVGEEGVCACLGRGPALCGVEDEDPLQEAQEGASYFPLRAHFGGILRKIACFDRSSREDLFERVERDEFLVRFELDAVLELEFRLVLEGEFAQFRYVKVFVRRGATAYHLWRRQPKETDDLEQLVVLARAREEGNSQQELRGNAAEGPHVDGRRRLEAEDDLGGAVVAGLDVRVGGIPLEARRAEIDEGEPLGAVLSAVGVRKDVLGLQIAVHNACAVEDYQGVEDLAEVRFDRADWKATELVPADNVEKCAPQKLVHDA